MIVILTVPTEHLKKKKKKKSCLNVKKYGILCLASVSFIKFQWNWDGFY